MDTATDKCVVCGEADQGKPLYKKLGSGEHNVEVIVALRELELTSLPESAKSDYYICWDCDETILQEYGRYLEYEEKRKEEEEKLKAEKKLARKENQMKKKLQKAANEVKLKMPKPKGSQFQGIEKRGFDTKKLSQAHYATHCVICGSTFETANRGYYRSSLKKTVNDGMDVASVMEFLGMARRIAPEVRAKRFVCNDCFYTLRRTYKDKLLKGTSAEPVAQPPVESKPNPIHRATQEEHAAEIAKLLPPALAECYKIMTCDNFVPDPGTKGAEAFSPPKKIADAKKADNLEEEEGVSVSQDDDGNYLFNVKLTSPSKEEEKKLQVLSPNPPQTPKKKKNVLLPKRHHHHLKENNGSLNPVEPGSTPNSQTPNGHGEMNGIANSQEAVASRTCNICGVTYSGKSSSWWVSLQSNVLGIEGVTLSMALQMLETSLANTNEASRLAAQVCNPCYGMVSQGFRRQVIQKISQEKKIEPSKVNLSKVKVRLLSKDQMVGITKKKEVGASNAVDKTAKAVDAGYKRDADNKRKNDEIAGNDVKKKKTGSDEVGGTSPAVEPPAIKNNAEVPDSGGVHSEDSDLSSDDDYSEDEADFVSSEGSDLDVGAQLADSDPSYEMSDTSDEDIIPPKMPIHKTALSNEARVGVTPKLPDGKRMNDVQLAPNKLGKDVNGNRSQKETPQACNIKEVLVVNQQNQGVSQFDNPKTENLEPIMVPNPPYNVTEECPLFFSLSQMHEPKLVLRDIGKSLPPEAYEGKTMVLKPTDKTGYCITLRQPTLPSSALQYMLNNLLPPNCKPFKDVKKSSDSTSDTEEEVVKGRCVVCASLVEMAIKRWHNLAEEIAPPSLRVPIRWVLASLSIAPVKLTPKEKEEGRVCEDCFGKLTKQFEEFVRVKIGESCGVDTNEVNVLDFVVTFNQKTMNIEADPAELTAEEEVEEARKLLESMLPTIKSFNIDSLLDESYIDPLPKKEFTNGLLLVLNEFRAHIGAGMEDLADWLARLMPIELHAKYLTLCKVTLWPYINSLVSSWRSSNEGCADKLNVELPDTLFVPTKKLSSSREKSVETKIKPEVAVKEEPLAVEDRKALVWEDFLKPVNFDLLLTGKHLPLENKDFNNGLLYALWRVANNLKFDNDTLGSWMKQLCIISLSEDHLKMLLNAPKPIHDHLLSHPEDVDKLNCVIIPEPIPPGAEKNTSDGKYSCRINGTKNTNVTPSKETVKSPLKTSKETVKNPLKTRGNKGVGKSELESNVAMETKSDSTRKRKSEEGEEISQKQSAKRPKPSVSSPAKAVATQESKATSGNAGIQRPKQSVLSPAKAVVTPESKETSGNSRIQRPKQSVLPPTKAVVTQESKETSGNSRIQKPKRSVLPAAKAVVTAESKETSGNSRIQKLKQSVLPPAKAVVTPESKETSGNSRIQKPKQSVLPPAKEVVTQESSGSVVKNYWKSFSKENQVISDKKSPKGEKEKAVPATESVKSKPKDAVIKEDSRENQLCNKKGTEGKNTYSVATKEPVKSKAGEVSSREKSEGDSAGKAKGENPEQLVTKVKELETLLRAVKHENQKLSKENTDSLLKDKKVKSQDVTQMSNKKNNVRKSVPTDFSSQSKNPPPELNKTKKMLVADGNHKSPSLPSDAKKTSDKSQGIQPPSKKNSASNPDVENNYSSKSILVVGENNKIYKKSMISMSSEDISKEEHTLGGSPCIDISKSPVGDGRSCSTLKEGVSEALKSGASNTSVDASSKHTTYKSKEAVSCKSPTDSSKSQSSSSGVESNKTLQSASSSCLLDRSSSVSAEDNQEKKKCLNVSEKADAEKDNKKGKTHPLEMELSKNNAGKKEERKRKLSLVRKSADTMSKKSVLEDKPPEGKILEKLLSHAKVKDLSSEQKAKVKIFSTEKANTVTESLENRLSEEKVEEKVLLKEKVKDVSSEQKAEMEICSTEKADTVTKSLENKLSEGKVEDKVLSKEEVKDVSSKQKAKVKICPTENPNTVTKSLENMLSKDKVEEKLLLKEKVKDRSSEQKAKVKICPTEKPNTVKKSLENLPSKGKVEEKLLSKVKVKDLSSEQKATTCPTEKANVVIESGKSGSKSNRIDRDLTDPFMSEKHKSAPNSCTNKDKILLTSGSDSKNQGVEVNSKKVVDHSDTKVTRTTTESLSRAKSSVLASDQQMSDSVVRKESNKNSDILVSKRDLNKEEKVLKAKVNSKDSMKVASKDAPNSKAKSLEVNQSCHRSSSEVQENDLVSGKSLVVSSKGAEEDLKEFSQEKESSEVLGKGASRKTEIKEKKDAKIERESIIECFKDKDGKISAANSTTSLGTNKESLLDNSEDNNKKNKPKRTQPHSPEFKDKEIPSLGRTSVCNSGLSSKQEVSSASESDAVAKQTNNLSNVSNSSVACSTKREAGDVSNTEVRSKISTLSKSSEGVCGAESKFDLVTSPEDKDKISVTPKLSSKPNSPGEIGGKAIKRKLKRENIIKTVEKDGIENTKKDDGAVDVTTKDDECSVTGLDAVGKDGPSKKVDGLESSPNKSGNISGKAAGIPKKVKPLFEELMTYDAS